MKRIFSCLSFVLFSSNVFASSTFVGKITTRRAPISNSDGITYWLVSEGAVAELGLPHEYSVIGLHLSAQQEDVRIQIEELAKNCGKLLAASGENPDIEVKGEIKIDIFESYYIEVQSIKQK